MCPVEFVCAHIPFARGVEVLFHWGQKFSAKTTSGAEQPCVSDVTKCKSVPALGRARVIVRMRDRYVAIHAQP